MPYYLSESERQENLQRVNTWLILSVALGFGVLLLRFGILQVVQHRVWSDIAENSQIRSVKVPAPRGNIYDRRHRLLADWRQSWNVMVMPADFNEESRGGLAKILGITQDQLAERIKKNRSWSPFIPVLVSEDIDFETLMLVEENKLVMPGVDIEIRPVRQYNEDSILAAHVLGYMGEIDRATLEKPEFAHYRMGDRIGQSGIEKSLELTLRGRDGESYKLVDALGRDLSSTAISGKWRGRLDYQEKLQNLKSISREQEPGRSVVLTLDVEFQRIARKHLGSNVGSVVAMDVKTGELLVLISSPAFDPSMFSGPVSAEEWKKISESPYHPLFNRAVTGAYPPGSVFKIVMLAAGLEEGKISPSHLVECSGEYVLSDTTFRCWNRYGHGKVDMYDALVESCDVYFYHLGESMGIDMIADWARRFGLGARVDIGLDEEKPGLIPDPEWRMRVKKKIWYPGETINVSIGQGYMLTTPLQAALIPAAVANNGAIMKPQIVHHVEDRNGRPVTAYQPIVMARNLMGRNTVRLIREAMVGVVEDGQGTAHKYARSELVRIAGKTGTSEISKRYKGKPLEEIPYKYRDHAWFVAYAPADNPEIAIAVMIEHGGSGGASAGAVAKAIIEEYFVYIRAARMGEGRALAGTP